MTTALNLNEIAQASTVQIVYCLVEGTLIAVFTAAALGLIRRQNSVTRFAAWFSALMAIATLPLLTGSLWSHVGVIRQSVGQSVITLPGSCAVYLFGAWAAISAWHFLGIGRGLWHLHTLRKSCVAIDPATLDARLQETMACNQSPRRIALCTSELAHVPTALGLVKPAIVIPEWVMQELSVDELNQILLHELAHLRRWDDWTNLAQKIVKALFFFHPAVWWIEKKVSLEREMACDDAVLAEAASPRSYAQCLQHLAEKTLVRRSLAFMQAALGRVHHTSMRVAQILDRGRPRGKAHPWRIALLLGGFAIACSLFAAKEPQLIAFQDSPSVRDAAAIGSYPAVPVRLASFKTGNEAMPKNLTLRSVSSREVRSRKGLTRNMIRPQVAQSRISMAASNFDGNARLMRQAKASTSMGANVVFVVIEDFTTNNLGSGRYEIQVWHLTIWHPAMPSVSEISHKEI